MPDGGRKTPPLSGSVGRRRCPPFPGPPSPSLRWSGDRLNQTAHSMKRVVNRTSKCLKEHFPKKMFGKTARSQMENSHFWAKLSVLFLGIEPKKSHKKSGDHPRTISHEIFEPYSASNHVALGRRPQSQLT